MIGKAPTPLNLEAWCREDEKRLMMLMGHISIRITDEHSLPLSSKALITNHVKDRDTLLNLVWGVLEFNYPNMWNLSNAPKVKDLIWNYLESVVHEAIDRKIEALDE